MNKKITVALVVIVLAITAVVLWNILQKKTEELSNAEIKTSASVTQNSVAPKSGNTATQKTVDTNDADIKGIETELNAVSENDFSVDGLSDQNLGL